MTVSVVKQGPVTTVILDRAGAKNAVDRPTAEKLVEAFTEFDQDKEAKVAVFCGENETFCAGADLKAFADPDRRNLLEPEGDGPMGPSRMVLSKPVIGAISGHAVAGGLELALWCDMRIVEEDAVMGVYCRRWGVPLIDGGTVRLPRIIGLGRAMDLILTGRPVYAEEALFIGLANRVVEKGAARGEAEKLARELSRFPQLCMNRDRLSAYASWDLDTKGALTAEGRAGMPIIEAEAKSGAARFADGKGRHGDYRDI